MPLSLHDSQITCVPNGHLGALEQVVLRLLHGGPDQAQLVRDRPTPPLSAPRSTPTSPCLRWQPLSFLVTKSRRGRRFSNVILESMGLGANMLNCMSECKPRIPWQSGMSSQGPTPLHHV